ncbi:MAG: hypothetical protein PF569_05705 [Candidatus Woesearchaeota archaeon]|jgi:uncharacterized membrane protein (DUF106 family)|nr:hypothetical protein [Candidatus Woesearchaeota archaeon]
MNETINETINQTIQKIPELFGSTLPVTSSPILDIYLITLLTSSFITLVNKYMSDQTKIRALKVEMKDLRKEHRELMIKDPKKAQKIQQAMMKKNLENMKHTMNPKIMIITMLPMLFLIGILRQYYGPFGEFFNFLGFTMFGWLGTYIVFSIINSLILKKVLDVA